MRAILLILMFVLCSSALHSSKYLDSLNHELSVAETDTTRIHLHRKIANYYHKKREDSALIHAQKAYSIAESISSHENKMLMAFQISKYYYYQSDYLNFTEYFFIFKKLWDELPEHIQKNFEANIF